MQSKTSFFNGTLFRRNLTRFWPLWGMASFVGALFPLALLMQLLRDDKFIPQAVELTGIYYEVVVYALPILSLLYAILCAMVVWSYLYNARSVSLMHTLPIRRDGLFITNFLSGMAMMLIPYVVVGGLCVVISLVYGLFDPVGLGYTVLSVLGQSFFYFASATAVAFITGNIFALPVLYFLLHFLAVMLDWLVSTFAQGFIFGLSGDYSGAVEWLSPTVYMLDRLGVERSYEKVLKRLASGEGYYDNVLVSVKLENFWIVGVYALVGVVLLAIAYGLYRRRRSESASDVVAVGWMKPLFRYGVSGLAALLGGILLYEIFWDQFQSGRYYDMVPMVVCMLVAGTIGYFAASMLLAKSLRIFKSAWKGLVVVLAGCAAVCCMLRFDLFGVADRVPEVDRVEQVSFYAGNNTYTFYPGQEDALVEQIRQLHKAIVADEDYVRALDEVWDQTVPEDSSLALTTVRMNYYLKNGTTVERRYYVYLDADRMSRSGTYDALLDQLVNSTEMKFKRIHLNGDGYVPDSADLYINKRNDGYDLNSREAAALLEAIGRDAMEGTWGTYDWFDRSEADDYAIDLSMSFRRGEAGEEDYRHDWISITLRPGMTHTIQCLKDLRIISDADLVTYRELYPENYEYEELERYPESVEVYYTVPVTEA